MGIFSPNFAFLESLSLSPTGPTTQPQVALVALICISLSPSLGSLVQCSITPSAVSLFWQARGGKGFSSVFRGERKIYRYFSCQPPRHEERVFSRVWPNGDGFNGPRKKLLLFRFYLNTCASNETIPSPRIDLNRTMEFNRIWSWITSIIVNISKQLKLA